MKGFRTKKISLPGGKVIEIIYFTEPGTDGAVDLETKAPAEGAFNAVAVDRESGLELRICPSCESDLVYPVTWEERSGDAWSSERRCPNCEWRDVGGFDQEDVELFDDALNDGTEELLVTLRNFARSNMEADIERLIEAIHLALIEPMDF
jgi:hypothetical protein